MKIRDLSTADDVIGAIGRLRLQQLTGKRTNNVTNWSAAGRFPPETYVVMQQELRRINCRAPDSLWRMIVPKKMRAA
jgi:hypothetical protein